MGKLGWSSQGAPSFSRPVRAWNGRYEDSVATSLSLALHVFCLYDRILFELDVDKGLVFAVGTPLCLAPLPPERHADAVPRMSVPPGHPTSHFLLMCRSGGPVMLLGGSAPTSSPAM